MRLTALLCVVATFQISAATYSQSTRISLNMKNVDIRDAFREIEMKSGLSFLYYENAAEFKKSVNINADNLSVPDIMDRLLKETGLSYKILNNKFIVISANKFFQQKLISGTVIDKETGEPVPGVNITLEGTNNGTITDLTEITV
ncbi:MAG: hypothetical protein HC831_25250 [Chloroflexia bacterium]|nr:hypothetical protein [Chloroflexia bacterium]